MVDSPDPAKAQFAAESIFYAIIGRFVTSYAAAEAAAHVAMRSISGLSDETARIIFGGMRLGDLADRLRKLTVETQIGAEIDILLTQLDKLGKERDRLAHRFVHIDHSELQVVVSNHWNARSLPNAESNTYSKDQISSMIYDCDSIMIRFMFIAVPEEAEIARSELPRDPYEPWRYIPPKPESKRQRRREGQ